MPRKRNEFGASGDAMLASLMNAGGTAASIAAALTAAGIKGVSRSTVGDRMRELRGQVGPSRSGGGRKTPSPVPPAAPSSASAAGAGQDLPSDPDDIPEGASVTQLDAWIAIAESTIREAQASKPPNLPLVGQMLRVAASLAETRRKATPPTPPDPNDAPDMVALGRTVAERLHRMVDIVAGEDGRQG